ncbi:MAG: hypothetical protein IKV30_00080 [Clostridia bacterium]|nr:hypothetical protein [Clostridia bacterium]
MFKKILSVLLVVASLFTLASCGKESDVSYIDGCIDELGQYKGLTIEISDAELEPYMVQVFKSNAAYVTSKTGVVGKIDTVFITTIVTCDGEKVNDLTLTDGLVSLGTNGNIKGFDEAIIGQTVGKTFKFTLTLPEDFSEEKFAGKEASFIATVSSVMSYPEITDATIKEVMYSVAGVGNLADFKVFCRNSLYVEKIVEHVKETTKINHLIEDDINECLTYYNEYYASSYLQQVRNGYQGTFSDYCKAFLGKTVDQLTEDIKKDAEDNATFMLVMYAIAEKEGYVATDDEIKELARGCFDTYGYFTPKAFIRGEGKEYLRYSLTQQDYGNLYMFLRTNNTLKIS